MKSLARAAAIGLFGLALAGPVSAQTDAPTAAVAPAPYSSATTTLGVLFADAAAKAVIDKHLPGLSTNERIGMASGMTLKDIQGYMPDKLSDERLAAIDADLAKLPVTPAK